MYIHKCIIGILKRLHAISMTLVVLDRLTPATCVTSDILYSMQECLSGRKLASLVNEHKTLIAKLKLFKQCFINVY